MINRKGSIKKIGRRLLLTMSLIAMLTLSAQVCNATYYYSFNVDVKVNPTSVFVNSPTTITIHVWDGIHPMDYCNGATGALTVQTPSGTKNTAFTTNSTGWYTMQFTPEQTGTYRIWATSSWDYSEFGQPQIGLIGDKSDPVNLTAKPKLAMTTIFPKLSASPTTQPSQQASPQAGTPTPGQPTLTPEATDIPDNSNPAGLSTDSLAPVTTLNLTGTANDKGEYTGEVIGNLTARDNEGGSGVSVIQYSFSGTDWYTYTKPLSIVKEGTTFVYYRSSDSAGNTEPANVKAVVVAGAASATASATAPAEAAKATPWGSMGITAITLIATSALYLIIEKARKKY